ncbi:MAG: hypothetical protein D3908_07755, partial [Candidatus Electrothrix sp. AUS4]|nr:hypothetical protein [Candidatus Electrothrix sp. AUS4]
MNGDNLPNFHLVEGDRGSLAKKYRMDVISVDAETSAGGQETHTVSELADMNNAIVAINGNHFDCLPDEKSDKCYEGWGQTGKAERIHIEDGEVKGKNGTKNVVFAFGGNSDTLIPIERLRTSGVIEIGNFDRVFEDVFLKEFNENDASDKITWTEAVTRSSEHEPTKIKFENGVLHSAIGEGTTLLYTLGDKIVCKPAPNREIVSVPAEDPWPAFGYGEKKILFLASDENSAVSDWDHCYQLCLVLSTKQAENAMLLDGGDSTQLAVRRPSATGRTEVVTANNDDNTDELRHVVNAIALVPKDQGGPEKPTSCPNGNGLYCGKSSLGQDTNYLYDCQDGNYTEVQEQCTNGCQENDDNVDDACNDIDPPDTCTNGGLYCGSIDPSLDNNTLYKCIDGELKKQEVCANGCKVNPPDYHDECEAEDTAVRITGVSPLTTTVGTTRDFTITGQNLPNDLVGNIEGTASYCAHISGSGDTVILSCKAGTVGTKRFYLKEVAGGKAISGSENIYIEVTEAGDPTVRITGVSPLTTTVGTTRDFTITG